MMGVWGPAAVAHELTVELQRPTQPVLTELQPILSAASWHEWQRASYSRDVELRHLRYFVAVAEELNFGRAAARLHVAQPGLSQQIKALEAELGVYLFERTKRRVRLTEAGSMFLAEAYAALSRFDQATEAMRQFKTGARRTSVRVAMFPPCELGPALVTELRKRLPQVVLTIEPMQTAVQVQAVERGELELGVVRSVPEQSPILRRLLASEPLGVCLPAGHYLATRQSIPAALLSDDPMIWLGRSVNPGLYDHVLRVLEQAGLHVQAVESAGGLTASLELIADGQGWAPMCESELAEGKARALAWRPFDDVDLVAETWAIWTRNPSAPYITEIVETLADICSRSKSRQRIKKSGFSQENHRLLDTRS
jgi:DNA-binding transcriptional LysR family regulator